MRQPHTALVKGAGPAGLASAAALAHLGFNVTVVEKRSRHATGTGRQNVVAIRPEALRNLDSLGALQYLVANDLLTDMTWGETVNQWDDSIFDWVPLFRRYPGNSSDDGGDEYVIPGKINEQIPSSYVHLGDLEDALLDVCEGLGVKVLHDMTVRLKVAQTCIESSSIEHCRDGKYSAYLVNLRHNPPGQRDEDTDSNPITPDLIVCASGKNDPNLTSDLDFRRHTGVKLDEDSLPDSNHTSNPSTTDPRALNLGEEGEIESQHYAVFAIRHPTHAQHKHESTNGHITHIVRKEGTGTPPQPLTEITMSHKDVTHFIIHLPRGLDLDVHNKATLESYVVGRVNAKLDTSFTNVQDMQNKDVVVVGDPLTPVLVETSTAPKYVFGSNVVLVGDAAMSCSPASGIGADIGMTVDSRNVKMLGEDLMQLHESEGASEDDRRNAWEEALDRFQRRKGEVAVIWSQASRMFYITGREADEILEQIKSQ